MIIKCNLQVGGVSEETNGLTFSHDQQMFLQATVAQLRTSLQLSHFHGRSFRLSRQQIDDYIIEHMFDNLSGI